MTFSLLMIEKSLHYHTADVCSHHSHDTNHSEGDLSDCDICKITSSLFIESSSPYIEQTETAYPIYYFDVVEKTYISELQTNFLRGPPQNVSHI